LASKTRHVRAALGLHPQLVGERANELPLWEESLPQTRYVGEVGLDAGPRYYKSLDVQKRVFERVLTLAAAAREKILTVHSVRAAKIVLDMIEKHFAPPLGKVVLHWFTGSDSEARRAVDLGCYFSVNAKMLETPRLRSVVAALPIERVLTETDGPFITIDSRPIRPVDVGRTVATLARLRTIGQDALSARLRQNLKMLLST
jgi:TatD DNase family protein